MGTGQRSGKGIEGRGRRERRTAPRSAAGRPHHEVGGGRWAFFDSWVRAASAAVPVWHRKLGGEGRGIEGYFFVPRDCSFPTSLLPCVPPLPESAGLRGSKAALRHSRSLAASPSPAKQPNNNKPTCGGSNPKLGPSSHHFQLSAESFLFLPLCCWG